MTSLFAMHKCPKNMPASPKGIEKLIETVYDSNGSENLEMVLDNHLDGENG